MPRFRRYVRRSRRRGRGRGRRSFKRFARRIATAGTEPKRFVLDISTAQAVQGDGTSPTLNIRNIPSNLIQGDSEENFHGNAVWLKGIGIRFSAAANDPTEGFATYLVRYTLLFSRTNATAMTQTGANYISTTTDSVAPTQAQPFSNPRLFDVDTTPARFTSAGYYTRWDRTNVKILGTKLITVNPGGAGIGMRVHKMYFRINRPFQYVNPDSSPLTVAPNHGKFGSYYLVRQVFTPNGVATPGDNTDYGQFTDATVLYFKDP